MKYLSLVLLAFTLGGCASFAKGFAETYNTRHTASTTARCYTLGASTRCELE